MKPSRSRSPYVSVLERSATGTRIVMAAIGIALAAIVSGCASDSAAARGAASGAGTGAVSGAVGGVVGALVFGGNPAEAAARGAVYGGAVGGTAGAMSGAAADERAAQQQEAGLAQLRERIGNDAFGGLEALAECRYDVSLKQAAKAQQSDNPNYALAGLWLEVLSYADARQEDKARALFPKVVEKDWNVDSETKAEQDMRQALNALMDIREKNKLPRVCSG